MAQRSRQAAAGVKGHHCDGGKVPRGKTLAFFRLIHPPWGAPGVEAGPLEGMERGRAAAHPPAQTPLQLAGVF